MQPLEETADQPVAVAPATGSEPAAASPQVREIGGPQGPDPVRYGDWERRGRCIDF